MANKTPKKTNEEEMPKFDGNFEDFIRAALGHESLNRIKKGDRVADKKHPKDTYLVVSVATDKGTVKVKKDDSDKTEEFNQDDLMVVE